MAQNSRNITICPVFLSEGRDAKAVFVESFQTWLRRMLEDTSGLKL